MAKKKKKIVRPQYVQKKKQSKPLTKNQKVGILVGIGVLVIAILLFALLYDDGSLKVKKGAIEGIQESWIVADLSNSSKSKYYKLGEIDPLEGFVKDPENSMKTEESLATDFYMVPEDETEEITNYYVTGVTAEAEQMAVSVNTYYQQLGESSEVRSLTLDNGSEIHYFIANFEVPEGQEGNPSQTACAYVPTAHDCSILINVSNELSEGRQELTEEQLTDWLVRIGETIAPEKED